LLTVGAMVEIALPRALPSLARYLLGSRSGDALGVGRAHC